MRVSFIGHLKVEIGFIGSSLADCFLWTPPSYHSHPYQNYPLLPQSPQLIHGADDNLMSRIPSPNFSMRMGKGWMTLLARYYVWVDCVPLLETALHLLHSGLHCPVLVHSSHPSSSPTTQPRLFPSIKSERKNSCNKLYLNKYFQTFMPHEVSSGADGQVWENCEPGGGAVRGQTKGHRPTLLMEGGRGSTLLPSFQDKNFWKQ